MEESVSLAHAEDQAAGRLGEFCWNLVGKKVAFAATGVVLYGWIVAHMIGNLLVFLGPAAFNGYAAFLRGTVELLWGERGRWSP